MKNQFLFELGTEEIPADMIPPAMEHLRVYFEKWMQQGRVHCESLRTYSSPRRLAVFLEGLSDRQPDREEIVLGPPKSIGLDEKGEITAAGQGFARKLKVPTEELKVFDTERGPYLGYRKSVPGKPVQQILQQVLLEVITSLSWPKNMYWRPSRFRFIRPLRWFVVLWNEEVLPFEFEGVEAGNLTRGHRFLGESEIRLSRPGDYLDKLRDNYVLADVDERRRKILQEIERQIPLGLQIRTDDALLEEVVHLNEYPSVLLGHFSEAFLDIPQEVLVTVMRSHQKYFSVTDRSGQLQAHFLTILNVPGDPQGIIRRGHEKVLKARLEDAVFFEGVDHKTPLKDRLQQLKQVLFQKKLGDYYDKTERVRQLCSKLRDDPHLETAATLCKTDLTTEMVREFPELQGIMGGLYARQEGYPREIWEGIYQHYRPISPEDNCPSTRTGALLSIADKLDTIVGCFGIDIIPTGSSDPLALRRQAQGIVRVLFDHQLDYSLPQLVEMAQKNFSTKKPARKTSREVLDFLEQRVRFILQEKGIAYDVLSAVLAVGVERVHESYEKALALSEIKNEPDFGALAITYKRIKNVIGGQPIELVAVNEKYLVEAAESSLFLAYLEVGQKVETHLKKAEYIQALRQVASLRSSVDRFFDEVLVLTDAGQLRHNRLRLLYEISYIFLRIADISEVVSTGESRK